MKKHIKCIVFLLLCSLYIPNGFANDELINRSDLFTFFGKYHQSDVPSSFQYIDLKYTDIKPDSKLEDSLQILVYLNLINNVETRINPHKNVDVYTLEKLAQKILGVKISSSQTESQKKSLYTTVSDLQSIATLLEERKKKQEENIIITTPKKELDLGGKEDILQDVHNTLLKSHFDRDDFEQDQLIEGAIQGLAAGAGDKYTRYFPPVESDNFFEDLDGEFEGIGAYVDMPEPGKMIIVSPIVGSPAEKAGIKGGDRVTHVDGVKITTENSLKEVVSWIKGPAGSEVKLTIIREGKANPLTLTVERAKIVIKDVEYKKIDKNTFYIQIKNFGENVDTDFKEAIEALKAENNIKKIIFDLRNNPGGYLGEVSNMLSFFIEKGEATAVVNYGIREAQYTSLGFDLLDLNDYEVIMLQNGGTASASEIMIGTIRDYFPKTTVIGEQSFGKGSVQSLKSYYDGSTLKYTSAKWFTGKSKQGIDGVGITPDIELEFDEERFKTYGKDNQLEKALDY